jgi:hypothetical protein
METSGKESLSETGRARASRGEPRWTRWGLALAETLGVIVAFLALGLGYAALESRAAPAHGGYVAERVVAAGSGSSLP